eukprot:GILJ01011637.1.p1 GENE.GILJ01011637.1~~GILJ01011637.1.p1  ORF type:complete len:280 (-),score=13.64 GILJ01011637.1:29-868(-)
MSHTEKMELISTVSSILQRHSLTKLHFYVDQGRKYNIRMGNFQYCYLCIYGNISIAEVPVMHRLYDELSDLIGEDLDQAVNIEILRDERQVQGNDVCGVCMSQLPNGSEMYICVLCDEARACTFCANCKAERFSHQHSGKHLFLRCSPNGLLYLVNIIPPEHLRISPRISIGSNSDSDAADSDSTISVISASAVVVCNRCQAQLEPACTVYQSPRSETLFWCHACVENGYLDTETESDSDTSRVDFQPLLLELPGSEHIVELYNTHSLRYSRTLNLMNQ